MITKETHNLAEGWMWLDEDKPASSDYIYLVIDKSGDLFVAYYDIETEFFTTLCEDEFSKYKNFIAWSYYKPPFTLK
jgi:hypothetical protein